MINRDYFQQYVYDPTKTCNRCWGRIGHLFHLDPSKEKKVSRRHDVCVIIVHNSIYSVAAVGTLHFCHVLFYVWSDPKEILGQLNVMFHINIDERLSLIGRLLLKEKRKYKMYMYSYGQYNYVYVAWEIGIIFNNMRSIQLKLVSMLSLNRSFGCAKKNRIRAFIKR